ncbi:hypothetical protein N7466_003978 [Penicillium verhagenii]|uniref:uncharacterized protein n=1 Tax=Penicillium verhagenii TaxID=1562060 RepID=UPI002544D91B|nr:uncharacterized protein N7466_003978 [Penicillium verhagenii]KAJ5934431.1 hypothetical protein N7466_003978 [Penicillium verhagenii]
MGPHTCRDGATASGLAFRPPPNSLLLPREARALTIVVYRLPAELLGEIGGLMNVDMDVSFTNEFHARTASEHTLEPPRHPPGDHIGDHGHR